MLFDCPCQESKINIELKYNTNNYNKNKNLQPGNHWEKCIENIKNIKINMY